MARRVAALAKAAKEHPADGSDVGLFIPLPEELAKQFPSLGSEDTSPPHATFMFVGAVPAERRAEFLSLVGKVLGSFPATTAALTGLDYFDNPGSRVAYDKVRFDRDLSALRWRLREALQDAGFEVGDYHPLVYNPHVTLAYLTDRDGIFKGPIPRGQWTFDSMQVWGLPGGPISVPLGQPTSPREGMRMASTRTPSAKNVALRYSRTMPVVETEFLNAVQKHFLPALDKVLPEFAPWKYISATTDDHGEYNLRVLPNPPAGKEKDSRPLSREELFLSLLTGQEAPRGQLLSADQMRTLGATISSWAGLRGHFLNTLTQRRWDLGSEVVIQIRASIDGRVPVESHLYHVTAKTNLAGILHRGLIPHTWKRPSTDGEANHNYPARIFLATSRKALLEVLQINFEALQSGDEHLLDTDNVVAIEIDRNRLHKGTKFYQDPEWSNDVTNHAAVYTYTHIPPSAITGWYDSHAGHLGAKHKVEQAPIVERPHPIKVGTHAKSIALMKFLAGVARRLGDTEHVYVVGGAVRNFKLDVPIKDIDVVVDTLSLGHDTEWFAHQVAREIPVATNVVLNQYGVSILTIKEPWTLDGHDLNGEVIEFAPARKESYGDPEGKGYKPKVEPSSIEEDVVRRDFTVNTLMWRLLDLANGPDKAEIIDITGCGLKDLEQNTLRCPADPDKTFGDDPTRMLRAVKFLTKYGLRIDGEVEESIQRNAHRLRQAPHNAISKILLDIIHGPQAKQVLLQLDKLGLLDVVKGMIQDIKPFREALVNWANDQTVMFMFTLMDNGLPLATKAGFLDPSQQERLREIAITMDHEEAAEFLAVLRQPGKVIDNLALMAEFGLKGPAVGKLAVIARKLLLEDPLLAGDAEMFTQQVRAELGGNSRQAMARRIALRQVEAGPSDWIKWIVQPFKVLWKHHKEFVSGPVDDAMDAVFKEVAPRLVKRLLKLEVNHDVEEFVRGALAGQNHNPFIEDHEAEDFRAGYAWGLAHPDDIVNGSLPAWMKRQVIQESIRDFNHQVTEQVLLVALRKVWKTVNPVETFKAILHAVKTHGWKMGMFIVCVELFEHLVLPGALAWLFNDKRWLYAVETPFGEVVYFIVANILGKVAVEIDDADENGHLSWYEQHYGQAHMVLGQVQDE